MARTHQRLESWDDQWCALSLPAFQACAAVPASGKEAIAIADVPASILKLVAEQSPGFQVAEAESELRNGQVYFDIEGTTAEGAEIEFDITKIDGEWTIVETQRDIEWDTAPTPVQASLQAAAQNFSIRRIIESDQGDGVIIYEFFGSVAKAPEQKIEVRYAAGEAEVLTEEWLH